MTFTSDTVEVRRAGAADSAVVSDILAQAFFDDPVISWAFPDDDRRRELLPDVFSLFVDGFLPAGEVRVTEDIGAALWMPPEAAAADEDPDEMVRQIEAVIGADAERFLELVALLDEHHPHEPAYYLLAVGVRPASQGTGVGSSLMRPVLEQCDRDGVAAYLEATSERSRKLYQRHGFEAIGQFAPTGAPPLWPMWRAPR
ncbi:MAG TPA: GNAT family N-acetyltransferase [Acidimicrobiales bacterium]|nr:GNAT family N-acetyltransferase [Acidimicrobiales bacterium]